MARRQRQEAESGIHHVVNRGRDRERIFFSDGDRLDFGRRLVANHEELGIVVLAYCLMDNHFHLVLRVPEPGTLSVGMQRLASGFTQHTNAVLERDGSLFKGRYHSDPIETDRYLLAATCYVHRNPKDIVGGPPLADYRWSSLGAYLGLRPVPTFLDTEPVMGIIGHDRDALLALSRGDDGAERRAPPWCAATPTITDVRSLVAWALVMECGPGRGAHQQSVDRTVLLLVADRSADESLRTMLHRHLDHRSSESRARATQRARARLRTDVVLQRVVTWVEAELARTSAASRSV